MMASTDELLDQASLALINAYAPYSGLRVGAAVLAASGKIYTGCNVESMAFPLGGCAEHHAIAAGVRAEGAKFALKEVAVAARDRQDMAMPIPPCGACRQLILEFGADAEVRFLGRTGEIKRLSITALLPESFVLDT